MLSEEHPYEPPSQCITSGFSGFAFQTMACTLARKELTESMHQFVNVTRFVCS